MYAIDERYFETNSDGLLVAEISELTRKTDFRIEKSFSIGNEKFNLYHVDRCGSDIAGWNFNGDKGNKVLIIND
jgi:hypothetical protein